MERTLHFSRAQENNKSADSCPFSFVQNTLEKNPNSNFIFNQNEYAQIIPDPTLSYISRILLEEEEENEDTDVNDPQNDVALQNMEKLFYDALGQRNPPSHNKIMPYKNQNPSQLQGNSSSISKDCIQKLRPENPLKSEFQKGVEEGQKFLPSMNKLVIDLWVNNLFVENTHKKHENLDELKLEEKKGSRGQKNPNDRDSDVLGGPTRKLSMVYSDEPIRDDMFDKILLNQEINHIKEDIDSLRKIKQREISSIAKNGTQEELVDLRYLLIRCSQAVAIDDHLLAGPLIKKIRKHSSSIGDGMQRLAFLLADGLEARLAGTGSDICRKSYIRKTTEVLKAHHLKKRAIPCCKVSYDFAKYTIVDAAKNASKSKLHIIDFGIDFGFPWPSLIQQLSTMKGEILKLRITGVDVPQPGFRPAERVDQTGRRLEDYAKSFGVPFEYHGIVSQNWETLSVEDFYFEKDELLVVNSMYRFRNLGDETTAVNSARSRVIDLILKIKPNLFIFGIFNGSYTSPIFTTRFQQLLHFFSSIFDALDSTIPRDNKERHLIESSLIGGSVINVIACEGSDRVDKPETYKQWEKRTLRAGFRQLPLDMEFVKSIKHKVGEIYDKRFFIDGDGQWLLQGWKGKVIFAISTWKPKET